MPALPCFLCQIIALSELGRKSRGQALQVTFKFANVTCNFVYGVDYAALRSVGVNAICMSRVVAPLAMSARTIKSSETEGSPASILAMRDWLDFMRCARSIWESFRLIKT